MTGKSMTGKRMTGKSMTYRDGMCIKTYLYKFQYTWAIFYKISILKHIIKNISSSTSLKQNSIFTSLRLSLREFKKILLNSFIYE